MIRVGITGQAGFIGTHLFNTLGLYPGTFERIPFDDAFFEEESVLQAFVRQCDVIVHLAAMNRHNDPEILYRTNIHLTKQLIISCEVTRSTPHILFSSSTQEDLDNLYGKSKKACRELLEHWTDRNSAQFSGLIIPNVFGPFGNPYYNSVVATFCHQLTHGETPKIEVDKDIKLIYVSELVKQIIEIIQDVDRNHKDNVVIQEIRLQHTAEAKVSKILQMLQGCRNSYFGKGELPALDTPFKRNLFNTFVSYIDHQSFFPFPLKLNTDNRGSFVEVLKNSSGGQVSFSTTLPAITRGNHFHTRKAERFAVIKGKARIDIRRIGTDKVLSFEMDGSKPSFVDMPVWYTHNITNVGDEELYTIFWTSEHFKPDDTDTFYEQV